jgi:predicted nuclease of predicted toxin-antitoxin system
VSLSLYMDAHVPRPLTLGLRLRGIDVVTAQEDGADRLHDPNLLDRATQMGRVLFTFDSDFLQEAAVRQARGQAFSGVILQGQGVELGQCLEDLELICKIYEPSDIADRVEYLPL